MNFAQTSIFCVCSFTSFFCLINGYTSMNHEEKPKKLLIVDDSRIMRRAIVQIFSKEKQIKIIGEARDGKEALVLLKSKRPDVITLDVAMPVMDGLTALKHIMLLAPTPTVMLSAYTAVGAQVTFDARRFGAVDCAHKPSRTSSLDVEDDAARLIRQVHCAANMKIHALRYIRTASKKKSAPRHIGTECHCAVVIGAGEGGYAPLLKIIPRLVPDIEAAFLVMLYAPSAYVDAFISYLDKCSTIRVQRAMPAEQIIDGVCYIASGEEYMTLHRENDELLLHLRAAPFAFRRGSINMLMFSVAEVMRNSSAGVLLAGAGNDGGEGLCEINRVGGASALQDPESCLYKDMVDHAMAENHVDGIIMDSEMAIMFNKVFGVKKS